MPRRAKTPRWLSAAREAGRAGTDWLERALGRAGVDAALIEEGRVRVDGKVVTKRFTPVTAESVVTLDGARVSLERQTRVLMLHKPAGVIAEGGRDKRPTVREALRLPAKLSGFKWHAVGRLDVDTTGLLLFTNDEQFVAHATSPESHLRKLYVAGVSEKATDAQLQPLRDGVTLDDGPARPAAARLRAPGVVEVTLTEGRNHQVKRMLAAVGLPVLSLHREAVGELLLDVAVGEMRELSAEEISRALAFTPASGAGTAR